MQDEASKYNKHLSMDKTKLIPYYSDHSIAFRDGSLVQQVSSVIYLGGLIDESGKPGPELRRRIGEARQVFQTLKKFGDMQAYRFVRTFPLTRLVL